MKQLIYAEAANTSATKRVLVHILIALAGSLFIALCSRVSLFLPFTSVPFTLQNHAVLLLAAVLGPRHALYSVGAYLTQGAMGLPVFVVGLGYTGGYLLSYLPVAYFVGVAFERMDGKPIVRSFLVLMVAVAFTLCCGAAWLSFYVGIKNAIVFGVLPFVITDIVKTFALTMLLFQYRLKNSSNSRNKKL